MMGNGFPWSSCSVRWYGRNPQCSYTATACGFCSFTSIWPTQCPTSASRVESLRQTLSRQRLIKFCKSYLHSLCRRCNKRFSLSKANASAVMLRATTSRFENFGATPHRGMFPNSFTRFLVSSLQIPKILTKFTLELRISNAIVLSCLVIV